jgi:hypothetical protein
MGRAAVPARYPATGGAWPGELRADMAAAFFDYPDTAALFLGVERREAPRPTGWRGAGRKREPIWCKQACESFIAHKHHVELHDAAAGERIEELV